MTVQRTTARVAPLPVLARVVLVLAVLGSTMLGHAALFGCVGSDRSAMVSLGQVALAAGTADLSGLADLAGLAVDGEGHECTRVSVEATVLTNHGWAPAVPVLTGPAVDHAHTGVPAGAGGREPSSAFGLRVARVSVLRT